jgi:phosphatidylserine/phosphatidylglycerophosphate/cardiolipin synthase-like enzyme
LANRIRSLKSASDAGSLSAWSFNGSSRNQLKRLVEAWQGASSSPYELAGMLLGASHALEKAKSSKGVQLVWTGPETPLVSTRRTEQALLEVIQKATEELFLVSFVAYEVKAVIAALQKALDRGVEVFFLIESSSEHGGKLNVDSVSKMTKALPSTRVYVWCGEQKASIGASYASVHAKCVVADETHAFITSANLTNAALQSNMELGVMIDGGNVPAQLHQHLKALIVTREIVEV